MTNLRSTLENAISDLDTAIERECLDDVSIIVAYMREALKASVEPTALQLGHWRCQNVECRGVNFPDDIRCIHCGAERTT